MRKTYTIPYALEKGTYFLDSQLSFCVDSNTVISTILECGDHHAFLDRNNKSPSEYQQPTRLTRVIAVNHKLKPVLLFIAEAEEPFRVTFDWLIIGELSEEQTEKTYFKMVNGSIVTMPKGGSEL